MDETQLEKTFKNHFENLTEKTQFNLLIELITIADENLAGHPEVYKTFLHLAELHSNKNKDYADSKHPLGNFERVGKWIQEYNLQQLAQKRPSLFTSIVYMLKQLDAVFEMLGREKQAIVEGVPEKLDDVAVYAVISKILFKEETNPK